MKEIDTSKLPLLQTLEDLGSLSERFGTIDIKPFRDLKHSSWANKIFTMRLCNAGEVFDIESYCGNLNENARSQALKIEILIRAIISIEALPLLTEEQLKQYNEDHGEDLSRLEFLRSWARNLEQVILDRLDGIYGGLQLKQLRRFQNMYLCEHCGKVFPDLPENSQKIKHNLGELICDQCLPLPEVVADNFDFELDTFKEQVHGTPTVSEEKTFKKEPVSSFEYKQRTCGCGKELNSIEELIQHREICSKAGDL